MWCDRTLIISNDKSEVNQKSIIPSKKNKKVRINSESDVFLIESLEFVNSSLPEVDLFWSQCEKGGCYSYLLSNHSAVKRKQNNF